MLHRCSGSIHQCLTMWRAEQCSPEQRHDGSTAQTHVWHFLQRAAKLVLVMTPLEVTHMHLPKGEICCRTNNEPICVSEFGLDKTGRQKKGLIPHTSTIRFYPQPTVAQRHQNYSSHHVQNNTSNLCLWFEMVRLHVTKSKHLKAYFYPTNNITDIDKLTINVSCQAQLLSIVGSGRF